MLCESVNCGERIKGRLEVSGIRTRFESPIGDRPVTNAAGPFLRPIRQAGEKYLNTRNGVATNSTRERISARAASHPPTREAVGRVGGRVCASRGGGLNRASPAGGNSPRPLPLPTARKRSRGEGKRRDRALFQILLRALEPKLAHQRAPLLLLGLDVGPHALDRRRIERN